MRKRLLLPFAPLGVALVLARPAAAEEPVDHAEAVSIAAHGRANDLRHRWDKARSEDEALASCLESKVMQAISVARRIDENRAALHDVSDAKERARRLAAIDRLAERTGEIERGARACEPGAASSPSFGTQAGTLVETKTSGNIAPLLPEEPDTNDLFGTFPPALWNALLRLR
jgi:hypothetical protein